jgi:hypothetical protein
LENDSKSLKESIENHEERITELELKTTGIEEDQKTYRDALKEVKD